MKTLVVVLGPTGVGKTELCLTIAEHLGIDIINADSRQIFAELPIGTAAPTQEQQQRVHHHFVGNHHLNDYYSASIYEEEVMALLRDKFERGDVAMLTGGSMMYIDAVCNGIDDIPTIDDATRQMMKARLETEGLPVLKIGLNRDRGELYERINQRVLDMMDAGLEDEARRCYPLKGINSLNTVGYREMFDYFDGLTDRAEAIRRIQSNSRRYMRKQLTWFKKDPEIVWFHPDNVKEIINYIDTHLLDK